MEAEQLLTQLKSFDICDSLKLKLLGNVIAIQPLVNTFLTVGGIRLDDDFSLNEAEIKISKLSVACNSLRAIVREEFRGRLVDVSDLTSDSYKFVMFYKDKLLSFEYQFETNSYQISVKESVANDNDSASYHLTGSITSSRNSIKQDIDDLIDEFENRKQQAKGEQTK